MLVVNWTQVTVDLSPAEGPRPPFGRRVRLREARCTAAAPRNARPCPTAAGNGMYDQRVLRGSNFVRPRPQTPPHQPSLTVQRKRLEANRRLRLKMRLGAEPRTHAYVQCVPPTAAEPDTRTRAVQHDVAQTDLTPGYLPEDVGIVPVKTATGLDASTQVSDADLIDFQTEWKEAAETLVSAVLNQTTACVMYEDDAAVFRREQNVYKRRRLAEHVELDRLNCMEVARRRRAQVLLDTAEQKRPGPAYRALHARALAAYCTADIADRAAFQLDAAGYTRPDDQMAWRLSARIDDGCRHRAKTNAHLDALIGDVIVNRRQVHRDIGTTRAN